MSPAAAHARLRRRHHVRHEQRVRVRLPARQHGDAARGMRPARLQLRDRRRGRLDPDRRGAHAADHQRHGAPTRAKWYVTFARDRAAAEARRGLRGRGVQVPGRHHRAGRGQGRGDPRHREPLRPREHHARAPPAELASRQGALQARRRLRGARTARSRSSTSSPAACSRGGATPRACTRRSRPRKASRSRKRTRRSPRSRSRTTSRCTTSSRA